MLTKNDFLDEIGIAYHGDADGVCAAAILVIAMKKLKNFPKYTIPLKGARDLKKLSACKTVFILDSPYKKFFNVLKGRVILFDHHVQLESAPKTFLVHYGKKPTCVLVYEELKKIVDLDDVKWLVAIGSFADKAPCYQQSVLRYVSRSRLYFFISLISSAGSFGRADVAMNSLVEAAELGSPTFIGVTPNSKRLIGYKIAVERETGKLMHEIKPEFVGKRLVIYRINSKMHVQGYFAGMLKRAHRKHVISVINMGFDRAHIDFRTDAKINMVEILKKCDLDDFGGHPQAAGCSISKRELENFIKKLKEQLEK